MGDPTKRQWVLDVVAKRGRSRGRALDKAIVATFPAEYVSDSKFDYGAWQISTQYAYDPHAALFASNPGKVAAFDAVVAASLADMGAASRTFIAALAPH
jgi:hypothetical protein